MEFLAELDSHDELYLVILIEQKQTTSINKFNIHLKYIKGGAPSLRQRYRATIDRLRVRRLVTKSSGVSLEK